MGSEGTECTSLTRTLPDEWQKTNGHVGNGDISLSFEINKQLKKPQGTRASSRSASRAGSRSRSQPESPTRNGEIWHAMENNQIPSAMNANENTPLMGVKDKSGLDGPTEPASDMETSIKLVMGPKHSSHSLRRNIKVSLLFIATVLCSVFVSISPEHDEAEWYQRTVSNQHIVVMNISNQVFSDILRLTVRGVFDGDTAYNTSENLTISVRHAGNGTIKTHTYPVVSHDLVDTSNTTELVWEYDFTDDYLDVSNDFIVSLVSTTSYPIPVSLSYTTLPSQVEYKVIYAAIVLLMVYVLITFDLCHRTLAAMLGALAALAVLSALNERPSLEKVVSWLDVETLSLLFGMMVLVAIFSETGFFDYCALMAYKLAKGHVWPLITILCVFAAVISAFLDNVTTILLMTPVTIRLCEVLNLEPKYILIAEVLFSNVGGTATAIGDPPNVIIVSNSDLAAAGVTFTNFTLHMFIGIIFITFGAYALLRIQYRNMADLENADHPEIAELKREIDIWKRASTRIMVVTREESMVKALLLQKVVTLENLLKKKLYRDKKRSERTFRESMLELEKKYQINDKTLLVKSSVVLVVVILCFFLHSFIDDMHLNLGWIAIMGALWLMVLADIEDMESVMHKVEWATLLFFAALFVLMEALTELGLIDWIGEQVGDLIRKVDYDSQLAVAIILILWVSAIASSFIDNIPFTTAMVPVIVVLAEDKSLNLDLGPLVWALAFGACLGGNGTLIGASANVVCAGIAEQHGYGFTFVEFFRVGFPMMLVTTLFATVYLVICHLAIGWNSI